MEIQHMMEQIQVLARAAAEEQVNATRSVHLVIITQLLHMLRQKDVLSTSEISAFCEKLDATSIAMSKSSPQISSAITEATLALRHALSLDAPTNHRQ